MKPFGLPAPAAASCEFVGGNYQIITESDGSQSGVCNYPLGLTCTDLQFYKEGGCKTQNYISGAVHFWPATLTVVVIISLLIYLLARKFKKKVASN